MSDRRVIQLPVVLDSANRRKDRSVSLRMSTTLELSNADFMAIDLVTGKTGYMLFSENSFSDADVPQDDAPSDTKKPSVRMRSMLFLAWSQNTDQSEPFEHYYTRRYEKMLEWVKAELT